MANTKHIRMTMIRAVRSICPSAKEINYRGNGAFTVRLADGTCTEVYQDQIAKANGGWKCEANWITLYGDKCNCGRCYIIITANAKEVA